MLLFLIKKKEFAVIKISSCVNIAVWSSERLLKKHEYKNKNGVSCFTIFSCHQKNRFGLTQERGYFKVETSYFFFLFTFKSVSDWLVT